MASSNPAISTVRAVASAVSKRNPAYRKKPSPLPLRPLEPDRFRPPRGQKQVFLPNFTLTFIRPPLQQPANFASFHTPLWMNKLDLKDYLYNLYGVQALHIRSYIIHGKVRRHRQTNRLVRASQQKKMTIEMKPGDNFVWPEVPAEVEEKKNSAQNEAVKMEREEQKENRSEQGQYLGNTAEKEKKGLREKARALLEGKVKWRPGWEESGTRMLPLEGEARSSASV